MLGGHVFPDRLGAAGGALRERVVELPRNEARVAELAHVAWKERLHELTLAEDAAQPALVVDDGEGRQAAVDDAPDGLRDGVVLAERGGLADEVVADAAGGHSAPLLLRS